MRTVDKDKLEWRSRINALLGYNSEDTSQAMKVVWGASVIVGKDIEKMSVDEAISAINRINNRTRCLATYNSSVRNNPDFKNLFVGASVDECDLNVNDNQGVVLNMILKELIKLNAQIGMLREECITFNEAFGVSKENNEQGE